MGDHQPAEGPARPEGHEVGPIADAMNKIGSILASGHESGREPGPEEAAKIKLNAARIAVEADRLAARGKLSPEAETARAQLRERLPAAEPSFGDRVIYEVAELSLKLGAGALLGGLGAVGAAHVLHQAVAPKVLEGIFSGMAGSISAELVEHLVSAMPVEAQPVVLSPEVKDQIDRAVADALDRHDGLSTPDAEVDAAPWSYYAAEVDDPEPEVGF